MLFYYPFGSLLTTLFFFFLPAGNIEALYKIPETFAALLLWQTFGNIKCCFRQWRWKTWSDDSTLQPLPLLGASLTVVKFFNAKFSIHLSIQFCNISLLLGWDSTHLLSSSVTFILILSNAIQAWAAGWWGTVFVSLPTWWCESSWPFAPAEPPACCLCLGRQMCGLMLWTACRACLEDCPVWK